MGEESILTDLLGVGEQVVDVVLGGIKKSPIGTVVDVIGATTGAVTDVVDIAGGLVPGLGGDPAAVQQLAQVQATPSIDLSGFGGGNGRFAKRTIVQTLDRTVGRIVSFEVIPGAPHIMNRDITAAKRVFRQVRKLDARLPKKTVKESDAKKIVNAVKQSVLQQITCGVKQPPC